MQHQSYIVTLDVDSICYLLPFNINDKVLAGSHKMGRVDTQLIGFLLLFLASVTRVKKIYQSFFINAETPLCVTIFLSPWYRRRRGHPERSKS